MKNFGPGLLLVAAFIGPGTVTTATLAGSQFGLGLLWAVVFSTGATIVLQEMAARLGIISRHGLGEALRNVFRESRLRWPVLFLVIAGIGGGNAAFQTGNITGAAIGLAALSDLSAQNWALVIGTIVFILLGLGTYQRLERILIVLVAGMSLVFLSTAILARPPLEALLAGLFFPSIPDGSALLIVALIGTTVVPYNLFLHAYSVQERWAEEHPQQQALISARRDTVLSVSIGGIVTLAIVSTAATAFFAHGIQIDSAAMMAEQLEPLLGSAARYFFACGLLCAGMTSAITAPLAAAYAIAGVVGWQQDLKGWPLRAVWGSITLIGTVLATIGQRPVTAIVIAQAINGLMLPVLAVFLLVVMNRRDLLGEQTNGWLANSLGGLVVIVVSGLGLFQLMRALEKIMH